MKQRFTLAELLVVVGVIVLIAAMLLPVLARARVTVKTVVCGHNLQQTGQTVFLYAEDNDNRLLRNYTPVEYTTMPFFAEHCLEYLGGPSFPILAPPDSTKARDRKLAAVFADHEVLRCPLQPSSPKPGDSDYAAGDHAPFTVAHPITGASVAIDRMTWSFCTNAFNFSGEAYSAGAAPCRLDRIPDPALYVYLMEANRNRPINLFGKYDIFQIRHFGTDDASARMIDVGDSRHGGSQANFFHFDGHVELRKTSTVTAADMTNDPNPS